MKLHPHRLGRELLICFAAFVFVFIAMTNKTSAQEADDPDSVTFAIEEEIDKIEKGKTTEDEIIAMFGDPKAVLLADSPASEQEAFPDVKKHFYPPPLSDEKVFKYYWDVGYVLNSTLLVTIDKGKGTVKNFRIFKSLPLESSIDIEGDWN